MILVQFAGPFPEPKPSWDDAPAWATALFADPLSYFWSDTMHVQYFIEFRPAPP